MNLLSELERLSSRLDPDVRQALLDEVRCHLDADIRARMEMGLDYDTAYQESVRAFGDPRLLVDRLSNVHGSDRIDPVFLAAVVAFFAGLGVALAGEWMLILEGPLAGPAIGFWLTVAAGAVFIGAWRAKRFPWKALVAAYPLATLFVVVGVSWAYHPPDSIFGLGPSCRVVEAEASRQHDFARDWGHMAKEYEANHKLFLAGQDAPPAWFPMDSSSGRKFSREELAQAWTRSLAKTSPRQISQQHLAEARRLGAITQRNWWRQIPRQLVAIHPIVLGWLACLAVLGGLGFFCRALSDHSANARHRGQRT